MIQVFQDLGDEIAANWKSVGQSNDSFPEIVTTALRASRVLEVVEPPQIIEWLGRGADIPEQYAKEFGQPPINVYVNDKFYIQVLFWLDGTTSIHEHSFNGAFGVLWGTSVHSKYSFEAESQLSAEVIVGNINFDSAELLKRGDIRIIDAGKSFIHALFHLDRPSVSVVVRTQRQANRQFNYMKPYIAYDAYHENKSSATKVRMLESLRTFDPAMFWKYAHLLFDQGNPLMLLQILGIAHARSAEDPDEWKGLVEIAGRTHGLYTIDRMVASIKEETRVNKLARLRSVIHDADLRFFLALLLNLPTRETLLALVAERFAKREPESLVIEWIRQLSDRGLFRSKTNALLLETIKLAMRCHSFDEAKTSWECQNNGKHIEVEEMKKMWEVAHASEFLQPLFR